MKQPRDYPCLLLSIQHWQNNQKLYEEDWPISTSTYDCACCNEVLKRADNQLDCPITDENGEFVCPIYAYTKIEGCTGTPYDAILISDEFEYAEPQDFVDWLTALYNGEEPELVDNYNRPTERENLI